MALLLLKQSVQNERGYILLPESFVLSIMFRTMYLEDLTQNYIIYLKLYRQIKVNQIGTNYAPLIADLVLFCLQRDFMLSLSDNNQAAIIEALTLPSRYVDE